MTILVNGGRTYRISSDAGFDLAIYNRFAGSFRLIHKRR